MKWFPKILKDNAYAQEILTSRREEKKVKIVWYKTNNAKVVG